MSSQSKVEWATDLHHDYGDMEVIRASVVREAIEECTIKDNQNNLIYPFIDKNRLLQSLGLDGEQK